MEAHDFEYRTAMKDIDRCVIDKAACEIVEKSESIIAKLMPYYNTQTSDLVGHNILGIRWKINNLVDTCVIRCSNKQHEMSVWKGVVTAQEIQDYVQCLGEFSGFLHTDYKPVGTCCRYHGNPIKGWQDWVKVECDGKIMMCQLLLFLEIENVLDTNKTSLQIGKYALTHFVNQNVFAEVPTEQLYGTKYNDFLINGNFHLVQGWAKKTSTIKYPHPDQNVRPIIGILPVTSILSPIIGIADIGNSIPHSYLFLPPRAEWPDFFVNRMHGLLKNNVKYIYI